MGRRFRVGVQLHPQETSMEQLVDAARRAEELGVDSLWTWDHFFPLYGDPDGAHFEGWMTLSALGHATEHVRIGHLVCCNSYRNPELLADMARTLDHAVGGRVTLGIGSGWFERDHEEYGYEFGDAIGRLEQLGEALPRIRRRLDSLTPGPMGDLPILVGGGGEKVTLRLVAEHADAWNWVSDAEDAHDTFAHKNRVLDDHCDEVGRDPQEIERTMLLGDAALDHVDDYVGAGADHLMLMMPPPFDLDPLRRLVAAADG